MFGQNGFLLYIEEKEVKSYCNFKIRIIVMERIVELSNRYVIMYTLHYVILCSIFRNVM